MCECSPTYKENTFDLSTLLESTQKVLGTVGGRLSKKVIKTKSSHLVLKYLKRHVSPQKKPLSNHCYHLKLFTTKIIRGSYLKLICCFLIGVKFLSSEYTHIQMCFSCKFFCPIKCTCKGILMKSHHGLCELFKLK